MSNKRCVGDILGLEIQLGDGDDNPTERVFCRIDEMDGTNIVPEFEILRISDGSFTNETQVMPDFDFVKVLYFIRRSNGTTPSNKYNPSFLSEVFVKDVTGQIVKDNLNVKLSSVLRPSNSSILEIKDKGIVIAVDTAKTVSATIEKKSLTGVING